MDHPVFKIRNLNCEYLPGTTVLQLEHLDIPRGQLVFVIGKSGIGKSTFIETLGLMNRTIAPNPGTSIQFTPENGEDHELSNSWNLPNHKISEFRKNHFSFIFQNTNLMPNFTSGENMMVSLLIKGKSREQAKKEVIKVMDKLSLDREIFDKKITEISGGQKQRLAFVRAITADFTVLFGDEPTGNLDDKTSEELMAVLKEEASEKGKTGVIVSHNLSLAEKFADMIVPITAKNKTGNAQNCGEVITKNILRKTQTGWMDEDGHNMTNIFDSLNHYFAPALSKQ